MTVYTKYTLNVVYFLKIKLPFQKTLQNIEIYFFFLSIHW